MFVDVLSRLWQNIIKAKSTKYVFSKRRSLVNVELNCWEMWCLNFVYFPVYGDPIQKLRTIVAIIKSWRKIWALFSLDENVHFDALAKGIFTMNSWKRIKSIRKNSNQMDLMYLCLAKVCPFAAFVSEVCVDLL